MDKVQRNHQVTIVNIKLHQANGFISFQYDLGSLKPDCDGKIAAQRHPPLSDHRCGQSKGGDLMLINHSLLM